MMRSRRLVAVASLVCLALSAALFFALFTGEEQPMSSGLGWTGSVDVSPSKAVNSRSSSDRGDVTRTTTGIQAQPLSPAMPALSTGWPGHVECSVTGKQLSATLQIADKQFPCYESTGFFIPSDTIWSGGVTVAAKDYVSRSLSRVEVEQLVSSRGAIDLEPANAVNISTISATGMPVSEAQVWAVTLPRCRLLGITGSDGRVMLHLAPNVKVFATTKFGASRVIFHSGDSDERLVVEEWPTIRVLSSDRPINGAEVSVSMMFEPSLQYIVKADAGGAIGIPGPFESYKVSVLSPIGYAPAVGQGRDGDALIMSPNECRDGGKRIDLNFDQHIVQRVQVTSSGSGEGISDALVQSLISIGPGRQIVVNSSRTDIYGYATWYVGVPGAINQGMALSISAHGYKDTLVDVSTSQAVIARAILSPVDAARMAKIMVVTHTEAGTHLVLRQPGRTAFEGRTAGVATTLIEPGAGMISATINGCTLQGLSCEDDDCLDLSPILGKVILSHSGGEWSLVPLDNAAVNINPVRLGERLLWCNLVPGQYLLYSGMLPIEGLSPVQVSSGLTSNITAPFYPEIVHGRLSVSGLRPESRILVAAGWKWSNNHIRVDWRRGVGLAKNGDYVMQCQRTPDLIAVGVLRSSGVVECVATRQPTLSVHVDLRSIQIGVAETIVARDEEWRCGYAPSIRSGYVDSSGRLSAMRGPGDHKLYEVPAEVDTLYAVVRGRRLELPIRNDVVIIK